MSTAALLEEYRLALNAGGAGRLKYHTSVFAALGDETRLTLLRRLLSGEPQSIVRLTQGSALTR